MAVDRVGRWIVNSCRAAVRRHRHKLTSFLRRKGPVGREIELALSCAVSKVAAAAYRRLGKADIGVAVVLGQGDGKAHAMHISMKCSKGRAFDLRLTNKLIRMAPA